MVTYLTLSKLPTVVVCGTCMNIWTLWWLCSPSQVPHVFSLLSSFSFLFSFNLLQIGTCYFWNYKLHTPHRLPTFCHSEKLIRAYYICFSWWPKARKWSGKNFLKEVEKSQETLFCQRNCTSLRDVMEKWNPKWKKLIQLVLATSVWKMTTPNILRRQCYLWILFSIFDRRQ